MSMMKPIYVIFCLLKLSHYPSRPIPVPELFCKYPTRPVPKSKTPTRRTLVAIYMLSRFTHFFRKYILAKIAFSATSHVFCMYGLRLCFLIVFFFVIFGSNQKVFVWFALIGNIISFKETIAMHCTRDIATKFTRFPVPRINQISSG